MEPTLSANVADFTQFFLERFQSGKLLVLYFTDFEATVADPAPRDDDFVSFLRSLDDLVEILIFGDHIVLDAQAQCHFRYEVGDVHRAVSELRDVVEDVHGSKIEGDGSGCRWIGHDDKRLGFLCVPLPEQHISAGPVIRVHSFGPYEHFFCLHGIFLLDSLLRCLTATAFI